MLKTAVVSFILLLMPCLLFGQSQQELTDRLAAAAPAERTEIYISLAQLSMSQNFQQADDYAFQAALLARENGQEAQLASAIGLRGEAHLKMLRLSEAEALLRESLLMAEALAQPPLAGRLNSLLAELYFRQGRMDVSLEYGLAALRIWEEALDTRRIIEARTNLSHVYTAMGQPERSVELLEEAAALRDRVIPGELMPNLFLSLFRNYRDLGNRAAAGGYAQRALAEALQQNHAPTLVDVYNSLGSLYADRGDYEQSYIYFSEALDRARQLGSPFLEAVTLNNIGNNFSRAQDHRRALGFYRLSNRQFSALEHPTGMITTVNNIGLMFENLNEPDSALVYYSRGLELSESISHPRLLAGSYNYTGNVYRILGRYELSSLMLSRAYETAVRIGSVNDQAIASGHFTRLYLEQRNFRQASVFADEFLQLSRQYGSAGLIEQALELLSELHEQMQQYEQSLMYFRQLSAFKDSLAAGARQEEIALIQEQLNLQLKERELENKDLLLEQQALVLRASRERLSWLTATSVLILFSLTGGFSWYRINQSRQKLLMEQKYLETEHRLLRSQMNPHFLFNALSSIQLFISEQDSLQAERYLSKFARLMRYYLDSSFTSYVLLQEEMEGLRLNVELEHLRLNKKFTYEISLSDDAEADHLEIPPMLAQPFIENAVKHGLRSKEEGGRLSVFFDVMPGGVMRCVIEDNGIGRQAAALLKKNNGAHTSRGIEITESRLKNIWKEQYRPEYLQILDLTAADGTAAGTRVEITFPYLS